MPTRTHRRPPRRHDRAVHDDETPRVMSSEEKAALIHAHHAARQRHAHPRGWGLGYYVGITASCLVIITGWWMTVGTNLRQSLSDQPDEAAQILQTNLKKFREGFPAKNIETGKQQIKANVDAMKKGYDQAVQEQQAFDAMAKKIQEMTTTSTKSN
ncbi:hypothetical protein FJZ48_02460 [Candidatus Uhrbacteria bacterium]|nr:hypothetical protein [Candidatus Uhrbacteria bacterium]